MGHTYIKKVYVVYLKSEYNWTSCVFWRPYLKEGQGGSRVGGMRGGTSDWDSQGAGCHERGWRNSRAQILGSIKASLKNQWSPKDRTDRYCFFPSMKSLALPSCNPMVSGKGFWEDEQLYRLLTPGWCLGRLRTTG